MDSRDDDDEDDSLTGPVAKSEGDVLPNEAYVAPSPPETLSTPQPPLPPSPPKRTKRRMNHSISLSLSSMWFELAASVSQAIEYLC